MAFIYAIKLSLPIYVLVFEKFNLLNNCLLWDNEQIPFTNSRATVEQVAKVQCNFLRGQINNCKVLSLYFTKCVHKFRFPDIKK